MKTMMKAIAVLAMLLPTSALADQRVPVLAEVFAGEFDKCDQNTIDVCHNDWVHKFSALVNRTTYYKPDGLKWWPYDLMGVMKFGCDTKRTCEIDALEDGKPLPDTYVGQQAVVFAEKLLAAYDAGTFVPVTHAHSWATPVAAKASPYFAGLFLVATTTGHEFYASSTIPPMDTSPRPRIRPQHIELGSVRPKSREDAETERLLRLMGLS